MSDVTPDPGSVPPRPRATSSLSRWAVPVLAEALGGGEHRRSSTPRPTCFRTRWPRRLAVIRESARPCARRVADGGDSRSSSPSTASARSGPSPGSAGEVGVVWFDAHGDFHTPDTTTSGFLDGLGLAMLLGDGWRELRTPSRACGPCPRSTRSSSAPATSTRTEQGRSTPRLCGRAASPDARRGARRALRSRSTSVYVHVDLDVSIPRSARQLRSPSQVGSIARRARAGAGRHRPSRFDDSLPPPLTAYAPERRPGESRFQPAARSRPSPRCTGEVAR